MSAPEEKRSVTIFINGAEVQNTLKGISVAAATLKNELANLTKGSDEYNKKLAELGKANQALAEIKKDLESVKAAQEKVSAGTQLFRDNLLALSSGLNDNPFSGYLTAAMTTYDGIKAAIKTYTNDLALNKTAVAANATLQETLAVAIAENTEAQVLNDAAIETNIAEIERQEIALAKATTMQEVTTAEGLLATAAKESDVLATKAQTLATDEQTLATKAQEAAQVGAALATNGTSAAMKVLKYALASTGIGFLLVALGTLVTYFESSNEGALKLKKGIGALNGFFQETLKVGVNLGKILYDVFSGNWKNLSSDIDSAKNSMSGFFNNAVNAGKASSDLVQQRFDLTKAERDWSTEKIKQQTIIGDLTKKLRDQNITGEERIQLAEKAKSAITKLADQDLAFAKQNEVLVNKEQSLNSKKDLQAIADAKNRTLEVIKSRTSMLDTIENKESALEKKSSNKQETAAQKAAKQADKDRELRLKTLADAAADVADAYGQEILKLDEHYRELEVKNKGNAATVEQLKKEHLAKLAELSDKYQKEDAAKLDKINQELQKLAADAITDGTAKALAELKAGTDAKLQELDKEDIAVKQNIAKQQTEVDALKQQGNEKEAKILEDAIARELDQLDASGKLRIAFLKQQAQKEEDIKTAAANAITNDKDAADVTNAGAVKDPAGILKEPSKNQFDAEQKQLDDEHEQKVAAAVKNGTTTFDIDAKYQKAKYDLKKNYADKEHAVDTARIAAVSDVTGALMGLVGKQTVAYKVFSVAHKAAAIAQVVVDGQKEIQGYWDAYSDIPFVGPIIAGGLTAAAVIRGVSAINTIRKADSTAGYETGGYSAVDYSKPQGYVNRPTLFAGSAARPFIAGEGNKTEYIISSEQLKDPTIANFVGAMEANRGVRRFEAGGYSGAEFRQNNGSTASTPAPMYQNSNDDVIKAINNLTQKIQNQKVILSRRIEENENAKIVQVRNDANA